MKFKVLCTGGAGYIGSHCILSLIDHGYEVTLLDNFKTEASHEVLKRLEFILNKKIHWEKVDLLDYDKLYELFQKTQFDCVLHCAGVKSVGESTSHPLFYYRNNVIGAMNLLQAMKDTQSKKNIIFSSSATVYKYKDTLITEQDTLQPSNPYGHSKLMIEQILQDLYKSDPTWKIISLRYFNPIGAHPSHKLGEYFKGTLNLLAQIQQAVTDQKQLEVFGNDWDTPDGTGVRDYIHIQDLAEGHIAAIDHLMKSLSGMCSVYNLGTGKGASVLEMIRCFEKASQQKVPYKFVARRPGDLASVVADASLAYKELNWKPTRTIEDGCNSAWQWQLQNFLVDEKAGVKNKSN